jgi:hypothetical protein
VTPDESLEKFLERPILVGTLALSGSTTTSGTGIISTTNSLYRSWSSNTIIYNKLVNYTYFRGNPRVSFQYQGSPTAIGQVFFGFYPYTVQTSDCNVASFGPPASVAIPGTTTHSNYPGLLSMLPGFTQINLEEATDKSVTLPFPLPANGIPILAAGGGDDWALLWNLVGPYDQCSSTALTTPPTLTIEIYVSYTDVVLMVPTVAQGPEEPSQTKYDGYISRLLSFVGSDRFVTPFQKMMQGAAGMAAAMGFSRPIITPQELVFTKNENGLLTSFANLSGLPFPGTKLAPDPLACSDVSKSRLPYGSENHTSFKYLLSKETMFGKSDGSSTIYSIYPSPATPADNISRGTFAAYMDTTVGFVANNFTYYSGPMHIRLQFVANAFCRQRVAVYIMPPGITPPTSYSTTTGLIMYVVEVVGRTDFEFDIPYMYNQPFMNCNPPDDGFAVSGFTVVPVTAAVNCPHVNIPYLVFLSAPQLVFALPSSARYEDQTLVPQGPASDSVQLFGEHIDDVLLLTRRPCYNFTLNNRTNTSFAPNTVLALPRLSGYNPRQILLRPTFWQVFNQASGYFNPSVTTSNLTPLHYISAAYLCCTGSTRISVVDNTYSTNIYGVAKYAAFTVFVNYNNNCYLNAGAGTIPCDDSTNARLVEIPSRNPAQFASPLYAMANVALTVDCLTINVCDSFPTFRFELSSGDDYVLSCFVCPPVVITHL